MIKGVKEEYYMVPQDEVSIMIESDRDIINTFLKDITDKMIFITMPIISIIDGYKYYN